MQLIRKQSNKTTLHAIVKNHTTSSPRINENQSVSNLISLNIYKVLIFYLSLFSVYLQEHLDTRTSVTFLKQKHKQSVKLFRMQSSKPQQHKKYSIFPKPVQIRQSPFD